MKSSYAEGHQFEVLFDRACHRHGLDSVIFPAGGERRGKVFIQVKTPCDRIVMDNMGRCAFIDCKSWGVIKNLTRSIITDHQVVSLKRFYDRGNNAGYCSWHRQNNKVIYYNASLLWHVYQNKGSVAPENGIFLGSFESMDPRLIFQDTRISNLD